MRKDTRCQIPSVYSKPDEDNALVKVYQALQALSLLQERVYIKQLHVFKIDGALNDILPIFDQRDSDAVPATIANGDALGLAIVEATV